jgi:hypothetical protein
LNPLKVDFFELYRRHLCRHSQLGINVLHLVSVAGIYIALFAIAYALPASQWIVATVLSAYFTILAFNIPWRLLAANMLFVALLFGIYQVLPHVSVWVYLILIFFWHRFQIWNHKIYDEHHDMSDFQEKYRKGPALFFLLSVYELPILLQYLMFRSSGTIERSSA